MVIRMPKAYPVYDQAYKANLAIIRDYLKSIENLQLVGRNGQHRYNNQDHSMLTGIFAARNVCGADFDVWDVNVEGEYHEEASSRRAAEPLVPKAVQPSGLALLKAAFARYDPIALASAFAVVPLLGLLCLSLPLILKGENQSRLLLLRNYLFGFDVTWTGAAIGALEVTIGGFVLRIHNGSRDQLRHCLARAAIVPQAYGNGRVLRRTLRGSA